MNEKPPIATVAFRIYRGHQLELVTCYLVRTPQGACWAYSNEADTEKDPRSVGAIELDPRHLEERLQPPGAPPLYLYRVILNVPPPVGRIPPSILASTRATQIKTDTLH